MGFGWTEIIMITIVVLLIFGPKRLPKLARSIGRSFSEVKKGMQNVKDEVEAPMSNLEEEATGWSRPTEPGTPEQEEPDSNKE